jgi:hypothetical protein
MCHHVILISDGKHSLSADFLMMLSFSFTLAANLTATGTMSLLVPLLVPYSLGSPTGLLAFRLYKVHRDLARSRATVTGSLIYPVFRTTIDAGALYTILLIAAIVNQVKAPDPSVLPSIVSHHFIHSFYISTFVQLVPSVSIIFYMVMIRVALAKSQSSTPILIQTGRSTCGSGLRKSEVDRLPVAIYVSSSTTTAASSIDEKKVVV